MLVNYDIALNLPNLLTVLRLLLTPFFLISFYFLFIFPGKLLFGIPSLVFFLLICATDILDGYVAREKGLITDFGASFDIAADFFFRFSSLILFSFLKIIPFWLTAIYLVFFISFILNNNMKWNDLNKITDPNPDSHYTYAVHNKRELRSKFRINIFGKTTPVIYNVFIGMIVLNSFYLIAFLSSDMVILISIILSALTLIAIFEGLVFSKA